MERSNLSIHGNSQEDSRPRIEIVLDRDGRPELLHDDAGGGRFAQVIRGFVGAGKLPQSIAIKLERDQLDPVHGSSKFNTEYQVQQQVHNGVGLAERSRIVRMIQMFSSKNSMYCDQLAPTLICPTSKIVLAPRCPSCQQLLRDDLSCAKPNCFAAPIASAQAQFEAIRAATPCGRCQGSCKFSYWLNQRTCKILLYELLDLDLQDYFDWRWGNISARSTGRQGWRKFNREHLPLIQKRRQQLHHARNPALLLAYEEWRMVLNLFSDVTAGVLELHHKNICHLDLKPSNLGLILDGARANLKILDLGHAYHPSVPWSTLHQSRLDDAETQRTDSPYWAPEQSSAFVALGTVSYLPLEDRRVQITVAHPRLKCEVLPGDYVLLPGRPYLEVIDAQGHGQQYLLVNAKWPESRAMDSSTTPSSSRRTANETIQNAYLLQGVSCHSDLYAIGVLLIQFVARGWFDVKQFQREYPAIEQTIRQLAVDHKPQPARVMVDRLIHKLTPGRARIFTQIIERATQDAPELQSLVKELIGIGLRACCRGAQGFSYVENRGQRLHTSGKALERLRADVTSVQDLLSILLHTQDLQFGRVFGRRLNCVEKLQRWLATQPQHSKETSPYDRDLIRNALDGMNLADDDQCQREFRWLLDQYLGDSAQLRSDIALFRRELEAGVTIAPMHPVMAKMFGLLNPGENMDQAQQSELRQRNAKWLAAHNQMQAALFKLNGHLDSLRRNPRLVWEPQDVEAMERDIQQLEAARNQAADALTSLDDWFKNFQKHRQQSISGWNRLADSSGWKAYGNFIIKQISAEQTQVETWLKERSQNSQLMASYAQRLKAGIVDAWRVAFGQRYDTGIGRWRIWIAKLFGLPLRAVLKLNTEQISAIEQIHQKTITQIQTVPQSPFSKFLPQN